MRTPLIVGGVVLVALLGGYYYQWQKQADNIAANAKATIDAINAGPEAEGIDATIRYEDLSVTGFPFAHGLVLADPSGSIDMTPQALEAWVSEKIGGTPLSPLMSSTDETPIHSEFALEGTVTAGISYLSTSGKIEIEGRPRGKDSIMGESLVWEGTDKAVSRCDVDFRSGAMMPMIRTFVLGQQGHTKAIIQELDALSCDMDAQKYVRSEDKAPLTSIDRSRVAVSELKTDPYDIHGRLELQIKDAEIFDEYRRFVDSIGSGKPPSKYQVLALDSHEMVGKMSSDVDITLAIKRDPAKSPDSAAAAAIMDNPAQDQTYFLIDARALRVTSNLWDYGSPFRVEIKAEEQNFDIGFHQETALTAHPTFDTALKKTIEQMAQDENARAQALMMLGLPDMEPQNAADKLYSFIPNLSGFGTIATKVNLDAVVQTPQGGLPTGSLTLKNLDFNTNLYSLNMNGTYDAAGQGLLNIMCGHCDRLLSDAVAYNNRIETALTSLYPDRPVRILSKQFYETLLAFLQSLDMDTETDKLTLAIKSYGDGNYTISGKPAFEVISDAMTRFQPYLAPAPAADLQPE